MNIVYHEAIFSNKR